MLRALTVALLTGLAALLATPSQAQVVRFKLQDSSDLVALEQEYNEVMSGYQKALSGENLQPSATSFMLEFACYRPAFEETEVAFLWTMDVGDLVKILLFTDTFNKGYGVIANVAKQRLQNAAGAISNQKSRIGEHLSIDVCGKDNAFASESQKAQNVMDKTLSLLKTYSARF